MRRGELRRYVRPSRPDRSDTVLITSSDGVNDSRRPRVIGLVVRAGDAGDRGDVLDVHLGDGRWVWCDQPQTLCRARCGEVVGLADVGTMRRVSTARRAAEDLDVD